MTCEPRPTTLGISVLVAADDTALRLLARRTLEEEGYRVDEASSGEMAIVHAVDLEPSVVVLDISMPRVNGLDVLRALRQTPQTSDATVLLLIGHADEADRLLGLELGADDYIVKPFFPRELLGRIRCAMCRRAREARLVRLEAGELVIDVGYREASVRGVPVQLTAREFDLLAFLASSPRQVFSREQLLRQVWGSSREWQDPSTVTEHIRRIRAKLAAASGSEWITTVRGAGYRFGTVSHVSGRNRPGPTRRGEFVDTRP